MCKKTKGLHNRIDPCLKDYIDFLVFLGFIPIASCCGHGKYHKTVVIEITNVKNEIKRYELISGIEIKRKRKFYVSDNSDKTLPYSEYVQYVKAVKENEDLEKYFKILKETLKK